MNEKKLKMLDLLITYLRSSMNYCFTQNEKQMLLVYSWPLPRQVQGSTQQN